MFGGPEMMGFNFPRLSPEEAILQAAEVIKKIRSRSLCGGTCPNCSILLENAVETVRAVFATEEMMEMMQMMRTAEDFFSHAHPFGDDDDVIVAVKVGLVWTTEFS